jgi:hypothetical protein
MDRVLTADSKASPQLPGAAKTNLDNHGETHRYFVWKIQYVILWNNSSCDKRGMEQASLGSRDG